MATVRTDTIAGQLDARHRQAAETAMGVRRISTADLRWALSRGVDDFRAMPRHLLFLAILYPIISLVLVGFAFNYDLLMLAFPLVAGGALLGPFSAIGLYELSRRREQHLDVTWWRMFDVGRFASAGSILTLGLILMALFVFWLALAMTIYRATFGKLPIDSPEFAAQLFTTAHGWALILLGNGVGALFAVVVFATTVVSFPMLVDRKVTLETAVGTSVRAVLANPGVMLVWGLIVVALLFLGALPLFVGLAVVLPVLGHATWHLYTRVVER